MILETIHLPTLYDVDPESPTANLTYSVCISILRDALDNCVLLHDSDGRIFGEIDAALKRWPTSRRAEAKELLTKLKKQNRFVVVPRNYAVDDACCREGCRHGLGIARAMTKAGVVGPVECRCRAGCGTGGVSVLTPESYDRSGFAKRRRTALDHEVLAAGSTDKMFEEAVWRPVFRYAKHIQLLDRIIGHTVTNEVAGVGTDALMAYLHAIDAGESPPPLVGMPPNFARGLTWVFDQYLRNAPSAGVFELTTEVGPDHKHPGLRQQAAAACVIHHFAADLSSRPKAQALGKRFNVIVKVGGRNGLGMPHARFLFTDQISLLVDRGFDLLDRDGVRDVFVKHVQNPGTLQAAVANLSVAPTPAEVLRSAVGRRVSALRQ